jgi:hypothetical protein
MADACLKEVQALGPNFPISTPVINSAFHRIAYLASVDQTLCNSIISSNGSSHLFLPQLHPNPTCSTLIVFSPCQCFLFSFFLAKFRLFFHKEIKGKFWILSKFGQIFLNF